MNRGATFRAGVIAAIFGWFKAITFAPATIGPMPIPSRGLSRPPSNTTFGKNGRETGKHG